MERRKDNQDLVLQKLNNEKIRHAMMGQYEPFFFFPGTKRLQERICVSGSLD